MGLFAQRPDVKEKKYTPFVNQLGYNLLWAAWQTIEPGRF